MQGRIQSASQIPRASPCNQYEARLGAGIIPVELRFTTVSCLVLGHVERQARFKAPGIPRAHPRRPIVFFTTRPSSQFSLRSDSRDS